MNGQYVTKEEVLAALEEIESVSDQMLFWYKNVLSLEALISNMLNNADERLQDDIHNAFVRKLIENDLPFITREARRDWL